MAAPTVAAIPEAPASASAARRESTEDETREKERDRKRGTERKTERDHRTSKIGRRRKRREKEGRKEGRGRLGVLADERIDPRRVKHGICLCPSSFSFDPRPRFLRALRASHSRSSSFSFAPARSPLLITLHGPPPEPPFALFSPPRTAAHPPPSPSPPSTLPGPFLLCRLKPPFSPLLRARPRQTKTNYAAFSEPQRAPTSYTTSLPFPLTPPPSSILVYLLPRNSPPTSPNHPHATFLVPAQTTPDQLLRPLRLRYVGHQMGAQPLRTPGERLVQERQATADSCNPLPTSARSLSLAFCSPPFPTVERACRLRVIIVDKPGMTSRGTSKLSIPVKQQQ